MLRSVLIAGLALAALPACADEADVARLERERVACQQAGDWFCVFDRAMAMYRVDFDRFARPETDPEGRRLRYHAGIGTELALDTRDTEAKLHLTGELFWLLRRQHLADWRAECFLVCAARAEALAAAGDIEGGAEFARVALSHSDLLHAADWVYPSAIHRREMDAVIILREEAASRLDALAETYKGVL